MADSTDEAMRTAHVILAAACIAATTALSGCGQKGPLYLRENPPPGVKPVNPDEYKPVPYPKGMPADAEPDTAPGK